MFQDRPMSWFLRTMALVITLPGWALMRVTQPPGLPLAEHAVPTQRGRLSTPAKLDWAAGRLALM